MREREGIFIPLKIAKRKRYKNAVDGVVLAAIQITGDPSAERMTPTRSTHVLLRKTSPPS